MTIWPTTGLGDPCDGVVRRLDDGRWAVVLDGELSDFAQATLTRAGAIRDAEYRLFKRNERRALGRE